MDMSQTLAVSLCSVWMEITNRQEGDLSLFEAMNS
jgi:hypothetical protein